MSLRESSQMWNKELEHTRPIDLESIVEKAGDVAKDVAAVHAEEVDREARWPAESVRALLAAGLGGLTVPEEFGGLGQGSYALAKVCETLGQECASTAMCFGMHCVGSAVLAAKATADQHRRYLTAINEGRHLTTLSLSEPGTGAHFYLPHTKLETVSADSYRINGIKTFVTNGAEADSYVVSTTVAEDESHPVGQFTCVVVPRDSEGMHWGPPWSGIGMRGNASRSLELRDVEVSRDNLLGEEGDHIWYVFQVVAPYFLMAMAGTYLGIASAALEDARDHLSKRHYSDTGLSLGEMPVLQHKLGTLWAIVERTRRLTYHAASSFDYGDPDALPTVFSSKAEVANCAVDVVNEVMTICGGIGYRENARIHRSLRDARAAHVMGPTTDILRIWTGRVLLGQPILA